MVPDPILRNEHAVNCVCEQCNNGIVKASEDEVTKKQCPITPRKVSHAEPKSRLRHQFTVTAPPRQRFQPFLLMPSQSHGKMDRDTMETSHSLRRGLQLVHLSSRIAQETTVVVERTASLAPHRGVRFVRSVAGVFSPRIQQQRQLHNMRVVADLATHQRSLDLLQSAWTSVANTDEAMNEVPSSEMVVCADAMLANDTVHRVLNLQSQWLRQALEVDKTRKPHGHTGIILEHYLRQFVDDQGHSNVPTAMDLPTSALVQFNELVRRKHLLPHPVKAAFADLCNHSMRGIQSTVTSVWDNREPCEVLKSLVEELQVLITKKAGLPDDPGLTNVLREFLEQWVFSRLAVMCYQAMDISISRQDAAWRHCVARCHSWDLVKVVGLKIPVPRQARRKDVFSASIKAFAALPHLVPTSMLRALLRAIRLLHLEAALELDLKTSDLSSDVLLSLLVFVLTRCELPDLHAQLFFMEQFVEDGSEAAYYLTSVRAAIGFIMTHATCTR